MLIRALFVLLAFTVAAGAQQMNSPSQVALQIDNVINAWAAQLEVNARTIADLQKQITDLKAKYEPAAKK